MTCTSGVKAAACGLPSEEAIARAIYEAVPRTYSDYPSTGRPIPWEYLGYYPEARRAAFARAKAVLAMIGHITQRGNA